MEPQNFPLALTYDDILLLPHYSDFPRSEISLQTHLTKKLILQTPFISAPMDTVTESTLAIALAKEGGIGIIHRNLPLEQQVKEVMKVKKKNLLVGAAVGSGEDVKARVAALVKAKVDVIVVDSAHGYSKFVIDAIVLIKNRYPQLQVIGGNIATSDGALALIRAGVDALRVGMGPGAICTTRIISGMGVPQVTALMEVAKVASRYHVPVIADGGIKYSGDMIKALAIGASTVMMGNFFAGTEEAPGKTVRLRKSQVPSRFQSIFNHTYKTFRFKEYRGMGSTAAMKKGAKVKAQDEFHGKSYKDRVLVSEGVEGLVPIRGSVSDIVDQAAGGIKSGMYYVGAKNISELWKKAQFIRITQASLTESHPHSILITDPGQNYL